MSIRIGAQVFCVCTIDTKIPGCTAIAELFASGTCQVPANFRHKILSCGTDTIALQAGCGLPALSFICPSQHLFANNAL